MGVDQAVAEFGDVAPKLAGSVTDDTAQIDVNEAPGDEPGIFGAYIEVFEDAGGPV